MAESLRRIILEACVLVALGVLLGLMLHHRMVLDAFSGNLVPPARPAASESSRAALPKPVLLEEVQLVKSTGGMIVDARSFELFAAGHIAGARSLPLVEVDEMLPDFLENVARDRTLIVYCSGFGCPDSFDLGMILIEAGYEDVRVFEGGYPEWRDAGLPVAGEKP